MNLLKKEAGNTPNYFCTWATQNYLYGCGFPSLDSAELEGAAGARHARDSMTEEMIFSENGWANRFHTEARAGLYLLLDDGWDVPPEVDPRFFGSLIVDDKRFPSCTGSPAQRLIKLNQMAKEAGWRGIGLWVAAQEAPALMDDSKQFTPSWQKEYWMERLAWSAQAGITYWKVDWGTHAHELAFRKHLTKWGHEEAPNLYIEHAYCQSCINDERPNLDDDPYYQKSLIIRTGKADAKLVALQRQLLEDADVLRSYDVLPHLSQVQTIERVSQLLLACRGATIRGQGLINCEDEVYVAAALGLCSGVMRFPLLGLRPGVDADCTFPTSQREVKRRMDEVTRLVRFQTLMPAFGVQEASVEVDEVRLTDAWRFEAGQTWLTSALGKVVSQSAPARIARGMKLPMVSAKGDTPFVLVARHPNGVAAVATVGRTQTNSSYSTPLADVTVDMENRCSYLGIFGQYAKLRLLHAGSVGIRLFAQDLSGDAAVDITASVLMEEDVLSLPGELLSRIGLSHASPGDVSEPGLLLAWK